MKKHKLPAEFGRLVEEHYLPLAERVFTTYQKQGSPYFVGINGCQGSGKSTLSDYLSYYLSDTYQLNVVVMSLDDFYLSRSVRETLSRNTHPLLETRGVPGTHNTALLSDVLAKVKASQTKFLIPRFNKATDDPYDESHWQYIDKPIDILILEGWCWGVTAQDEAQLRDPINTLEKEQDQHGVWRSYVNSQLSSNYQPLYKYMHFWVALQAPSFDNVYRWRLEQEEKLIKTLSSIEKTNVMNDAEILNFIQYFQRLTTQGMYSLPLIANTIFYLEENRCIKKCVIKD